jgi:hypothetical protein
MSTPTPNPGGQQKPTAPGKPSSRQPPESNTGTEQDREEGQEIPKTGRDPSEPIDEDIADDTSSDDNDADDADGDQDDTDEEEVGTLELPGEGGDRDPLGGSRPAGNP